jgi:hypothetical protein
MIDGWARADPGQLQIPRFARNDNPMVIYMIVIPREARNLQLVLDARKGVAPK